MSAGRVLAGAMIGMATGAVLGVLFAPDKGSNTRKRIARQGSQLKGALKEAATGYVETLEETIESARETAVGIADRVTDAVESLSAPEPRKHARRT